MYKQCIQSAFARNTNNSLDLICTEIADIAKRASFPNGNTDRMFVCALVPQDTYVFIPLFKDIQGPYIEYLLKGKHLVVIKDLSIDSPDN